MQPTVLAEVGIIDVEDLLDNILPGFLYWQIAGKKLASAYRPMDMQAGL